jgi:hypothetical protein
MDEVLGNSAENIKPAIDGIVNTYSFDKNKIRGNYLLIILELNKNNEFIPSQ